MIYVENLRKEFKKTVKEPGCSEALSRFFIPRAKKS